MTLAIVIINYKTPDVTTACLRSLAPEVEAFSRDTGHAVRVIVTDNASGDGSVEKIAAAIESGGWGGWARLVPLPRNGGFSYGNNRGIEQEPDADYFLLLNSDTLVHPGVLKACLGRMEAEPTIGMMSCLLKNPDGSVQNAARRLPTPLSLAAANFGLPRASPRLFSWASIEDAGWDRLTDRRDVGWVGGAFMFIRGSVLRKIGGLDEDFFFYGEDIEFSHRFWKAGYRVHYDPAGSITHIGGSSSDPTRVPGKQKNLLLWKARYTLQRKCHGAAAAAFVRGADILASGLRSAKLRLKGRGHTPEYRTQRDVLSILLRPIRAGEK